MDTADTNAESRFTKLPTYLVSKLLGHFHDHEQEPVKLYRKR